MGKRTEQLRPSPAVNPRDVPPASAVAADAAVRHEVEMQAGRKPDGKTEE